MSSDLTVIVLAAGGGTRMKSKTMKVLHEVGGRSMIGHVLTAVQAMEPTRVVAVVGHQREQVGPHIEALLPGVVLVVQEEQQGTGHAVRIALEHTGHVTGTVVVAAGDTPLLEGESLAGFVAEHEAAQSAVSILSGVVRDPFGYGRIVRNDEGDVEAIIEEKDASDAQRAIREISSGILAFDAEFLSEALGRVGNDNAKGEYYLTDTVGLARDGGLTVSAFPIDDVAQTEGANDREQLARLGRELNARIVGRWMRDGVTVMDPATTWIDADVVLEPDATVLQNTQLKAGTLVRRGAVVGPANKAEKMKRMVSERLKRLWPEIGPVSFDHVWNGYVGMTTDFLPRIHRLGPDAFGWTGCNGRAVALSIALGDQFSKAVRGYAEKDLALPFTEPVPIVAHALLRRLAPLMLMILSTIKNG